MTRVRRFARIDLARLLVFAFLAQASLAHADDPAKPVIPNLFDPGLHRVKPDVTALKTIRFLTTEDLPPFHFNGPDGSLTGFDIDLARAICADLKIACTIQARRFETLVDTVKLGQGDALVAALANTTAFRADLAFTAPYYTRPARFVTRAKAGLDAVTQTSLRGKAIGVQAGTAHLAYLQAFFPKATPKTFPDAPALRAAIRDGAVDTIFGDGIALSLWLNDPDSKACCAFVGGPYTESYFFGEGVSIAVAKENVALRQILDYELDKLTKDGTYTDLYLKYFPIGFY